MHRYYTEAARNGDRAATRKLANSKLLREEIDARRSVLRALPEIVTFHSTDICNLRCVMCPRHLGQGTHKLDDNLLRLVADELLPTALKTNLTTAGGEPLGVGFETLLERVRRHDNRLEVTTNGLLMTREKFLEMQPALDHLNISVDCVVPEIYERIRVGASFEQLAARLAMMVELRRDRSDDMLFSLSAVVMAATLPHLGGLVRFAKQHGADGVVLQRLQHDVMPTWHEDVTRHFTPTEIERHLDAAEQAAREAGISIVSSGFGRAPQWFKPMRAKVPNPLDGVGICSFLTQTFTLMFTGEVYPCCRPTDYRLGNVHTESPYEIWNGAPLRSLREAHYNGRGTLFCSGCDLAPHLAPRSFEPLQKAMRSTRRWLDQRRQTASDKDNQPSRATPLPPPAHHRIENAFPHADWSTQVTQLVGEREATALDQRDGSLWMLRNGTLLRAATPQAQAVAVIDIDAGKRHASLLAFVRPGVLLASFEDCGSVTRIDTNDPNHAHLEHKLSDERASVRTSGLAVDDNGVIWIGEYGVAPGLRCAIVHRSFDGGMSFSRAGQLPPARHVHAVAICQEKQRILVTTGDVGMERATFESSLHKPRWRRLLAPLSGFTAIASTTGWTHFGTDLADNNGLVRMATSAEATQSPPEYRALPATLDLQVRQIEVLRDGHMIALLTMDEDLRKQRAGAGAALLMSTDHGANWSIAHRFSPDWSDAPERFLVTAQAPLSIVTEGADRVLGIELSPTR